MIDIIALLACLDDGEDGEDDAATALEAKRGLLLKATITSTQRATSIDTSPKIHDSGTSFEWSLLSRSCRDTTLTQISRTLLPWGPSGCPLGAHWIGVFHGDRPNPNLDPTTPPPHPAHQGPSADNPKTAMTPHVEPAACSCAHTAR